MLINRRQSIMLPLFSLPGLLKAEGEKSEVFQMLNLPGIGADISKLQFDQIPLLKGTLSVISPFESGPDPSPDETIDIRDMRLNLHNYLAYHSGKFWCMWSDGPRIEDNPTQEVRFATSTDGIHWSRASELTGRPPEPVAYIARGFWVRNEKLIALAAKFRGKGAFGNPAEKSLELIAFEFDRENRNWIELGLIQKDAINNYPPLPTPDGKWILTRRDSRSNISALIGGINSINEWEDIPITPSSSPSGFRPDEPIFLINKNGEFIALFRNNGLEKNIFRSISVDQGHNWTKPLSTNFPNNSSKLFSLNTRKGHTLIILNANTALARRELHLALSIDGQIFSRMARLDIPSPPPGSTSLIRIERKLRQGVGSLQYPHAVEHEDHLYIAFSRAKIQIEIFKIAMKDIESLI